MPFNRPSIEGSELEYLRRAIDNGHISGDGLFTRRASRLLETMLGERSRVLLTTSCTHALEMSAMLIDLAPGDEVIVPAFTFVSGVNAFVLRGARPRFVDIRPDTLNIDEEKIEPLITARTRAVAVVHYAGVACEMDSILQLAKSKGIPVIEDNAHGLFGAYKGTPLGTFGSLATQSFHETKNISCGEGGALVINEPSLLERAEIIREKGTDRSRFFRGEVDKYRWMDLGSSYVPSDMLAGYLLGQLEKADAIQSKRKRIWNRYADRLAGWGEDRGVRLPVVPDHCSQPFHMFYLLFRSVVDREDARSWLRSQGVMAVFHYHALNASPMGLRLGAREGDCPVAENVSDRLLRLPLYNDLSEEDQDQVVAALASWNPR